MGLIDSLFSSIVWAFYLYIVNQIMFFIGLRVPYLCVSLTVILIFWEILREFLMLSTSGKSVFITGCDSGFGLDASKYLAAQGYFIFAGVLDYNSKGAEELSKMKGQVKVLKLDVTSNKSVDESHGVIDLVLRSEGLSLWGVINNAGVFALTLTEVSKFDDFERVLQINALGTMRVSTKFADLLRESKGRLINVSSFAGRMATPFCGAYNASKYAIEGFSDSLRYELAEVGVKVVIVEPGNYGRATRIFQSPEVSSFAESSKQRLKDDAVYVYTDSFLRKAEKYVTILVDFGRMNTSPVMKAMYSALTTRFPRARYQPMGVLEKSLIFINELMPPVVLNIISRVFFRVCDKI